MRRTFFTLLILTGFLTPVLAQSDYFLLPEDFYPHKTDTLNLHLLSGNTFSRGREQKYDAKSNIKFTLHEGSKSTDITPLAKDGKIPVLSYKYQNSGLLMVEAVQNYTDEFTKREYTRYLNNDGFDDLATNLKQFQQSFKIKSFVSLKTLIAVDKSGGGVYDKPLKEDFEIVLKQNPYKLSYGDDITAVVMFKGQPLKAAKVDMIIRTPKGSEFPQALSSTEAGEIYFKLSREGTYMLHAVHIEPSKDQTLDYESWQTAITFSFSSSDTMPNSYKEFGLGNMH